MGVPVATVRAAVVPVAAVTVVVTPALAVLVRGASVASGMGDWRVPAA